MESKDKVQVQVQVQEKTQEKSVLKKPPTLDIKPLAIKVFIGILVIFAGIGTGWILSGRVKGIGTARTTTSTGVKSESTEVGLSDESTFKDSVEGVLEDGGIQGEGTHHLVRPGGESQNVYLTSTVIDLSSFVGKKVKVWGQTISARKAGWLMDVGRVKVLE